MRAFGTSDLNKLVRTHQGNRDRIIPEVKLLVWEDPELVLKVIRVQTYLTAEEVRSAIERVFIEKRPESYLPHIDQLQNHIPDEELRERLIGIHRTHPWVFYINAPHLQPLFPNEFFRRLLDQGHDFFRDDELFKIFLLWNAQMPLMSFNARIQQGLRSRMESAEEADVFIEEPREPGFACGGMDKNFHEAAKEGKGLCLVNGLLLGKHYHTKGADKANKVTYVARRSQPTTQGKALWSDEIYAPSDGQHAIVVDAIEQGRSTVEIPHLTLRPVRPLIDVTSRKLFELFHASHPAESR